MKYAKYLARQSIPEWQNHYFKYKKLKKELKILVRISESNPAKLSEAQQEYVDLLYEEMENVNDFFEKKEKEIIEQYDQLKSFLADSWRRAPPSKRSLISFPSFGKHREKKKRRSTSVLMKDNGNFSLEPTIPENEPKKENRKSLPASSTKTKVSFDIPLEETNNKTGNNRRHTIMIPSKKPNPFPNSNPNSNSSTDIPASPKSSDSSTTTAVPKGEFSDIKPTSPPQSPSFSRSSPSSPSLSSSPPAPAREPLRDGEMPQPYMPHDGDDSKQPQRITLAKRFKFAIKRSLEEVHRGLSMLKDFSALNSVGFRKIIKKHDKVPGFPTLSYFLEHEVYKSHFHTSDVPSSLLKEVETVYANMFTKGNLRQATDKLQVPNTEDLHDWVSFRFGLFVGACVILVFYLLGKSPDVPNNHPYSENILYCFRFLGIPILWLWTFASIMGIWHNVRINYVFIFGWNPRKHITPQNLFEIAAAMSCLWLLGFVGYYNSVLNVYPFDKIPGAVYPFIPLVIFMLLLLFPFNIFYRSSRWWMFQTILRIVRTPMLPVKFKDFFYTNQFTSMKYAFSDMGDTIYFYTIALWREENENSVQHWTNSAYVYRPLLQAYPSLLRFLQCLRRYKDSKDTRHLINAGKYSMSVLTVLFSGARKAFPQSIPILIIYSIIASISSLYSWSWDVLMDWDLGYSNCKTRLRPKLMYGKPIFYYTAIVADLILRGVWAVTLGTSTGSVGFSTYPMNTIASVSEIIRRFIWNIFRLENEHLKNCHHSNAIALPTLLEQYRSVGQVKTFHMKDYEEEEDIEGEKEEEIIIGENEQELLDQATGIRHRRIGVEMQND